jgi:hypothetical protein
MSTVPRRNDSD